jgi:hypothetical protein
MQTKIERNLKRSQHQHHHILTVKFKIPRSVLVSHVNDIYLFVCLYMPNLELHRITYQHICVENNKHMMIGAQTVDNYIQIKQPIF